MKPKVLDLFSGIGGFTLAFEAAGFETIAFSEIEPYPCKILAQHWPEVPNLGDIRKINGEDYRGAVDVICGGFPCQDISVAGKGLGLDGGERSILWYEMLRVIRGTRPAFCLIENVPALRTKGADGVLNGLEEAGYTGRPFVVGAVHAGAPHRRQRVWIVAYRNEIRCHLREYQGQGIQRENETRHEVETSGTPLADCLPRRLSQSEYQPREKWTKDNAILGTQLAHGSWWATEPGILRVAHGVRNRAHRIKALGNSIVPQVCYPFAQWIYSQLKNEVTITKNKGRKK